EKKTAQKKKAAESKTPATKEKTKVGVILLSVFFGIIIFVFGLYGALALPVSVTLADNELSYSLRQSNPSEVLLGKLAENEDLIAFLDEMDLCTDSLSSDMNLSEFIAAVSGIRGFTDEDVAEILEKSDIMAFAADILMGYEDYIRTGTDSLTLNRTQLKKLVDALREPILEYSDYDIIADKLLLDSLIDENMKEIKKIHPSETIGGLSTLTSILLNPVVIIAVLVLAVLLILCLIAVGRSPVPALLAGGIPLLIDGGVTAGASLLADLILKSAGVALRSQREFILGVISPLTDKLLFCGLFFAAVGAVLIIGAVIAGIIRRRLKAK
ncbi:MAG: hypothetical protein ACI4J4_08365, partial [Ruminiclostridium sp.]